MAETDLVTMTLYYVVLYVNFSCTLCHACKQRETVSASLLLSTPYIPCGNNPAGVGTEMHALPWALPFAIPKQGWAACFGPPA